MEQRRVAAACTLCEAICGIRVDIEGQQVVGIRGDPDDPFSKGHICPKATALGDIQHDPDRVRRPLRRTSTGFEEVSWSEALGDIVARTHALQSEHGRDSVAAYVGNPAVHNLGSMLYVPDFLRTLGSRNTYSATSLDQLPHMLAAAQMFGHPLLMPVPDVDRCDVMVILGGNPVVSNGSIMTAPGIRGRLDAIAARGRLVVVDPRRTETAARATEHHFIRPGTDAWLLLGLLQVLLDDGPDWGPLAGHVDGVEVLHQVAGRVRLADVSAHTGIDEDTVRSLAAALRSERAVLYGRLGACAQRSGGVSGWLLYAVNAVAGNLDRPGGLMFTQPAVDPVYPPGASRKPRTGFARWRSRVRGLPEFSGELPTSTLSDEIETPGEGQVRGLFVWSGNPVLSAPNGTRLERALEQLELLVSVDLYVNETARRADYVLPAVPPLGRDHYDVAFHALAVRNTAKFVAAPLPTPGDGDEERHDWRIAQELMERLLRARGAGVRQRLSRASKRWLGPRGQLRLGLRLGPWGHWHGLSGITLGALRSQPSGVDLGPLQPCVLERSPLQRLQLAPPQLVAGLDDLLGGPAADASQLLLIGRRDLRSANSWLHNAPRLMKGKSRCTLLVHPDDAAARGLQAAGEAVVRSRVGEVQVPVEITDAIMPGVVSLPHGWGHHRSGVSWTTAAKHAGHSVNDLTDDAEVDPLSGNAVLNGVPVEVQAIAGPRSMATINGVDCRDQ
ncbi:MAG: molybdopterin-dependent oxidoreductase [Myxococcales bacterium]|nr:molybdopterin-dependent oxidoreductase [Myxococcales bacterium]